MVEATCQCLLAQAEEGEKKDLDPVQIEKQVYLCAMYIVIEIYEQNLNQIWRSQV